MKKLALCLILVLLQGCATIMGSDTQHVTITSVPPGADVKIVDEAGAVTFQGQTPADVVLPKTTGHYFGGKAYTVSIAKQGFATQTVEITHRLSNWYEFGNIFPAGPLGYFAIDPFNGGMYLLGPDAIDVSLSPAQAGGTSP
ncbi:MAG TPA: hypothetical protein VGH91_13070 [Gammaproteobacteria bacterium]|jgi:hypothetical protein